MGYSRAPLDPETTELKPLAIFSTNEIEIAAREVWEEAMAPLEIKNTDVFHPQPLTPVIPPTHGTLDPDPTNSVSITAEHALQS